MWEMREMRGKVMRQKYRGDAADCVIYPPPPQMQSLLFEHATHVLPPHQRVQGDRLAGNSCVHAVHV